MKQIVTLKGTVMSDITLKAIKGAEHLLGTVKFVFNTVSKTDENGSHDSWMWLDIWDDYAVKYKDLLKKGSFVSVTGELFQRRWNEGGSQRSNFRMSVEEVKRAKKDKPASQASGKYAEYIANGIDTGGI